MRKHKEATTVATTLLVKSNVFLEEEVTTAYADAMTSLAGGDDAKHIPVILRRIYSSASKGIKYGSLSQKDTVALEHAIKIFANMFTVTPEVTEKVTYFYQLIKSNFPEYYSEMPQQ